MATVAVFIALGSGAAIALPGRNTVDSGDIINNQVRGKDVRNETIGSDDVTNGALSGGDIGNFTIQGTNLAFDTITGVQIQESSLGQVPSAANAANATSAANANTVGGLEVKTFQWDAPGGANFAGGVFTIGSLSLVATCTNSSDNLELFARTSVDNSYIRSSNGTADADFDSGQAGQFEVQSAGDGADFFAYREAGSNDVVQATFVYDEAAAGCDVAGTAIGK